MAKAYQMIANHANTQNGTNCHYRKILRTLASLCSEMTRRPKVAENEVKVSNFGAPKGIIAGRVNMAAYAQWLDDHGYNVNLTVGGGR